jgi:hypothetical protein
MRIVVVLGLCVILAGCGLMARKEHEEQQAAAKAQSDAAMADCETQFPKGGKRYIEKTQCQNAAITLVRPFMPYPDLVDQDLASRMAVAEKLQAGKITLAEANLEQSTFHSNIVAGEQRRLLSNRSVGAQESAAAAAWRASSPVSCTKLGNTVNCY